MIDLNNISRLLLDKSKEGKIAWDSATETEFYTELEGHIITVRKMTPRGSFNEFVILTLTDNAGNVIEKIQEPLVHASTLAALYEVARRRALDIDRALSEVAAALRNL